jgi:ABC-type multidrug transport system fused ATPase/permease subunit
MAKTLEPARHVNAWWAVMRLRSFVAPHWRSIGLALMLLVGEAATDLLKPWPMKLTLDVILKREALVGSTLSLLVAIALLVVALAAVEGLLGYLAALCLNRAGRQLVFELRSALFDHIHRLSLQFHHRRSTGDLMARVTSDVTYLRDALTESVAEIARNLLFLVGMGGVLLWLDWKLSLILLAATPILCVALVRYSARVKERSRAERRREGALAAVVHETLGTIRMIRVFNREEETRRKFRVESTASLESGLAAAMTGERFSWMVDLLGGVVTALVLAFGVKRVMDGAITPGSLVVFVSYIRSFYKSLKGAIKHTSRVAKAAAPIERVAELLDAEEGVTDQPGAQPAAPFLGRIEFCDVRFEYEPQHPVLDGIDLVIPACRLTAIVGPTGGGKSTLTSLIPRLYDPTAGQVYIDGQDIRHCTLRSVRSQISVVLQESVLLQASVAENIAYGRPDATFDAIERAARAANAHDFIRALPDGYDTVVGERGETLSGGQRQRIAIARAIVRNAPIVILDEPLTGLDAAAAAAVSEALDRLMRDKTVILVTHHLAMAQRADQIVVLMNGRIQQQGRHDELVAAKGLYRELCEAQFGEILVRLSK